MPSGKTVKAIKPAELFKICGIDLGAPRKKKLGKYTADVPCAICRIKSNSYYLIQDVFSESFTMFNKFTHSNFVCEDCASIITDDAREKYTGLILYWNPETNEYDYLKIERKEKVKSEIEVVKDWCSFVQNPPPGYFLITLQEKQNSHYLPYAKVCYSDGRIDSYQYNFGDKILTVDVKKLVELANKYPPEKKIPDKEFASAYAECLLLKKVR